MALPTVYQAPETYLTIQIQAVKDAGSAITDFSEGSVARTLLEAFSVALSAQSLVVEQMQNDTLLATATGDALDAKAADSQVTRNPAVQATGTIRASRPAAGSSILIPAGFAALSTRAVLGQDAVAFVTTVDATLLAPNTFVDIPAQAVLGGVAGNVAGGTAVIPSSPILGIATDGGFATQGAFTGGVEEETDDALRLRVPKAIQGRVKGRKESFESAALAIPGVASARALKAGDVRSNATVVPAGSVEVYYEGSATLLTTVTAASLTASVLDQTVSTFTAVSEQILVTVTVFASAGTDTVQLTTDVKNAIMGVVNGTPIGGTAYQSDAIRAVHAITSVLSMTVPFGNFRKSAQSPGVANDLVSGTEKYLALAASDITVTVTLV